MSSHKSINVAILWLLSFITTAYSQITSCPGIPNARFPMTVAEGWTAKKVADGLTKPRGIILDPHGRLIMVEAGSGISQHTVDAEGCVNASRTLIANPTLNHGVYLSPDGGTLYASSASTAWSWAYDAASGDVSAESTALVRGMVTSGHVTRTLIVPPGNPHLLVVSHGSDGNLDHPAVSDSVARAIVKVFDLNSVPEGGYNYVTDGWNAGYGLRNEVALVFDGNEHLWGVENSADDAARTANGRTIDIHTDNPSEELNYLGDVTQPNDNWYGYPTCFTVHGPEVITDTEFQIGDQYVLTPNATFNDTSCAEKSVPPSLTLPAHTAPMDAAFDSTFENLYVTLHGSWNRDPPQGYKLVEIPFAQGADGLYAPVAAKSDPNGFNDILYHPNENQCSSSTCTRPVGLVFDSAGRLFMGSDGSGELFLLTKS